MCGDAARPQQSSAAASAGEPVGRRACGPPGEGGSHRDQSGEGFLIAFDCACRNWAVTFARGQDLLKIAVPGRPSAYRQATMGGMDAIVAEPRPAAVTEPRPKLGLRAMVIEDEPDLAEVIADYLQRSGFDVEISGDGAAAVTAAHRLPPDVVVLDLGLPSLDGVEVCRQLRTFSDAYVVMVTARADEVDTLVGLSVGADDYLTKPFSPRELIARIEAMLRRPRAGTVNATGMPLPGERRIDELVIDPQGREVNLAGKPIALTRTEFDLLDVLSRRPGMVFSRDQLLSELWGPGWVGDAHVVDVHIASLRRKLGDTAAERRYIRTIRGIGYRMGDGRSQR